LDAGRRASDGGDQSLRAHRRCHRGGLVRRFFSQPLLLLVAGGAAYRAFEKSSADIPVSYGVTAYFIIVVAVLGYLSTLAPLGAHTR
jgi:hypothetical protein